jgi:hypothetical protein
MNYAPCGCYPGLVFDIHMRALTFAVVELSEIKWKGEIYAWLF